MAVFVCVWGGGGHTLIQTSAWDRIGALPHAGALRVRGVSRLFHLGGVLRGCDSQYLAVHGRQGDITTGLSCFLNSTHSGMSFLGGSAEIPRFSPRKMGPEIHGDLQ